MLSSEITCLYEILTLNHLIPGDANLGSLHPDPAHALARLAGGHALEAAVTRSLADFLLRVRDELERTRAGQSEPADLPQRLEALPAWVFNQEYLDALQGAFRSGTPGLEAKIWNLICFGLFYDQYGH